MMLNMRNVWEEEESKENKIFRLLLWYRVLQDQLAAAVWSWYVVFLSCPSIWMAGEKRNSSLLMDGCQGQFENVPDFFSFWLMSFRICLFHWHLAHKMPPRGEVFISDGNLSLSCSISSWLERAGDKINELWKSFSKFIFTFRKFSHIMIEKSSFSWAQLSARGYMSTWWFIPCQDDDVIPSQDPCKDPLQIASRHLQHRVCIFLSSQKPLLLGAPCTFNLWLSSQFQVHRGKL